MARRCNVNDVLGDDVLMLVLAQCGTLIKIKTLPLVRRRWNKLLSAPLATMWGTMDITAPDDVTVQHTLLQWMRRRIAKTHTLHYTESWAGTSQMQAVLALTAALTPRLTSLQAHGRVQSLAAVQLFSGLTHLCLKDVHGAIHTAQLSGMFAALPMLVEVDLSYSSRMGSETDQQCGFPASLAACTALKVLSIAFGGDRPGDFGTLPEQISCLGNLQTLALKNCKVVHLPDTAGSCWTALQTLHLLTTHLGPPELSLPPGITALTALTAMAVSKLVSPFVIFPPNLVCCMIDQSEPTVGDLEQLSLCCKELELLRLCYCKNLEDALPGLRDCNADKLLLDNCSLQSLELPQALAANLFALSLEDNDLTDVPPIVEYMTDCTYLDLSDNPDLLHDRFDRHGEWGQSRLAACTSLRWLAVINRGQDEVNARAVAALFNLAADLHDMTKQQLHVIIDPSSDMFWPDDVEELLALK